jgi:AcrR family transcriptional regulator
MKKEARREQILESTLNLLKDKTLDSIRTIDIANASGITEGALFKYFSSKNELLNEIILRQFEIEEEKFTIGEINSPESLRQQLNNYYSNLISVNANGISQLRLLLDTSMRHDKVAVKKYCRVKSGLWDIVEEKIDYGKKILEFLPTI